MRPDCLHGSESGSGYYNSVLFVCLFVTLFVCLSVFIACQVDIVGSVVVGLRSMCDVNCSSAITPHCLVLICLFVCLVFCLFAWEERGNCACRCVKK